MAFIVCAYGNEGVCAFFLVIFERIYVVVSELGNYLYLNVAAYRAAVDGVARVFAGRRKGVNGVCSNLVFCVGSYGFEVAFVRKFFKHNLFRAGRYGVRIYDRYGYYLAAVRALSQAL